MSPSLAAVLFGVGIFGLFRLDREEASRTSSALWIPIAWMLIGGSRRVSQWLQTGSGIDSADRYLEGNPVDRLVLTGLLVLGLIVLAARGRRTGAYLPGNAPLVIFFAYCAVSALWSEYPAVALKRWTTTLGDIVMVLLV